MNAPTTVKTYLPKVRRVRLPYGEPAMQRHFAKDDIAFSHLVALLSFAFPAGEELVIRSIRRYNSRIADPLLKKRVAGLIGQETMHTLQHRALNEKLADMGYRYEAIDHWTRLNEALENALDSIYPAKLKTTRLKMLALTTAIEHWAAGLAERLLQSEELQSYMTDQRVRELLFWHAIEEIEHRSVSFDVFQAMGGSERMRIKAMRSFSRLVLPAFLVGIWISVLTSDPYGRRHPFRLLKETIGVARSPLFRNLKRDKIKPYLKRDFHPDQIDNSDLLEQWREKLFGEQGTHLEYLD